MKGIPENVKVVAKYAGPFVVVLFLFFLVASFGMPKVGDVRSEIRTARATQNTLRQKVEVLQEATVTVAGSSDAAAVALPDSNTALSSVSQIKILASQNGIFPTSIKTSAPLSESGGIMSVNISFEVEGARSQIAAFLRAVPTIAPITIVNSVDLNETGGIARSEISLKSFWAPFPKTIPKTEQAISRLTPEEEEILSKVSALTSPVFTEVPAGSGGRLDPFNP